LQQFDRRFQYHSPKFWARVCATGSFGSDRGHKLRSTGQKGQFDTGKIYCGDQKARVTSHLLKSLLRKAAPRQYHCERICPGYIANGYSVIGPCRKKVRDPSLAQISDRPLGRTGGDPRQRCLYPCQRMRGGALSTGHNYRDLVPSTWSRYPFVGNAESTSAIFSTGLSGRRPIGTRSNV